MTYRKENILLVLVDGASVSNHLGVFDYGDRLSSQDGLVNPEGCRMNLCDPNVGGHFVSDCEDDREQNITDHGPSKNMRLKRAETTQKTLEPVSLCSALHHG